MREAPLLYRVRSPDFFHCGGCRPASDELFLTWLFFKSCVAASAVDQGSHMSWLILSPGGNSLISLQLPRFRSISFSLTAMLALLFGLRAAPTFVDIYVASITTAMLASLASTH